jgi:hypothetical protein
VLRIVADIAGAARIVFSTLYSIAKPAVVDGVSAGAVTTDPPEHGLKCFGQPALARPSPMSPMISGHCDRDRAGGRID